MKLRTFRVGPYRNILDSGTVEVQPDVTVLVGKNESGKTNLLHALETVRPARSQRQIERLDYPRWLQKNHERSGEFGKAKPVELEFTLTSADQEAVAQQFGEGVLTGDSFSLYRQYKNDNYTAYIPSTSEAHAVKHLVHNTDLSATNTLDELRAQSERVSTNEELSEELRSDADSVLERIGSAYSSPDDPVGRAVCEFLRDRVPRFYYFDEYSQLPGTTDTAPLVAALGTEGTPTSLSEAQSTALALLRLGFADEEIIAERYEERKAELQAVAAELSRDVHKYWKQNPHLRLEIDINPVEETDPQNNRRIVRRELKLEVMDQRHFFTNSLDARSSGFRWFISFLAGFSEFEQDDDVIVLLDEPGVGLHARAQRDFLRFIDDRLAADHQVIFTTHSPFMVRAGALERVRVVEDRGPDTGAKVHRDLVTGDRDTLFPLQAALGYDIAQHLFIGEHNLAVEGISDFTYLSIMSDHLESLGRTALDSRWRILPAGGSSNIPAFVALLGAQLDVTILVDGDTTPGQRIQNLIDAELVHEDRVHTPAHIVGKTNADIEDLFSEGDYLKLWRSALGSEMSLDKQDETDRIVARIERLHGLFNHNVPANYLLSHRDSFLKSCSQTTLSNFECMIERINGSIG